jgi:DNA segregation ATPase FtsK/SpoIIIE, S-DNA-T family
MTRFLNGTGGMQTLMPMVGMSSSLVMMLVFRGSIMVVAGAVVLVVTAAGAVGMHFSQRGHANRQRRQQRERFLDYLERFREGTADRERAARASAVQCNPRPEALFDLVRDPARLWERRRGHADFLHVRVGVGAVPVIDVHVPERASPAAPTDQFMLAEAKATTRRFAVLPGMPLTVPLDTVGNVSVVGDRADVLATVRAMLVQMAALHAPDDVGLAVAHPPEALGDWAYAKWLPHALSGTHRDGPVAARRIATDPHALAPVSGLAGNLAIFDHEDAGCS